jgi:hypothetical protein
MAKYIGETLLANVGTGVPTDLLAKVATIDLDGDGNRVLANNGQYIDVVKDVVDSEGVSLVVDGVATVPAAEELPENIIVSNTDSNASLISNIVSIEYADWLIAKDAGTLDNATVYNILNSPYDAQQPGGEDPTPPVPNAVYGVWETVYVGEWARDSDANAYFNVPYILEDACDYRLVCNAKYGNVSTGMNRISITIMNNTSGIVFTSAIVGNIATNVGIIASKTLFRYQERDSRFDDTKKRILTDNPNGAIQSCAVQYFDSRDFTNTGQDIDDPALPVTRQDGTNFGLTGNTRLVDKTDTCSIRLDTRYTDSTSTIVYLVRLERCRISTTVNA